MENRMYGLLTAALRVPPNVSLGAFVASYVPPATRQRPVLVWQIVYRLSVPT